MALAEKDAVVAQLFGAHGALMDFVDILNAAVQAVKAEFHADRSGALTANCPARRSRKRA